MKLLNFNTIKGEDKFLSNYKLHDLSEFNGKNLLTQWGISFKNFGEDQRYKKVWERGKDKPDVIVEYNGKALLIDWKSKHKAKWIVNKRAVKAYEEWSEKLKMNILIAFFVYDNNNQLLERRFAFLGRHNYIDSPKKEWDKNLTVEFVDDLPVFNKPNLIKALNYERK